MKEIVIVDVVGIGQEMIEDAESVVGVSLDLLLLSSRECGS